ncbi:carbohydrate-binding module family 13 protein [Athelia psychrophila]|uniref:Carbohydrate-binding module family 13 protein n=1 Tax=Athelia psychrophila TaxID=1759441 RepID=A0A166MGN7_9AGAM|nr:carbohydrate-binding module family 13 protein [Fibularhizoctonia sp. CBS 109695]
MRTVNEIVSDKIYRITNVVGETVIDLSGGDNKSIIGYGDHNGPNQRWIFHGDKSGWTIKSAGTGVYLGVDKDYENGVAVAGVSSPFHWLVEKDKENHDAWRISIPGTKFNLDLADHGNKKPGTPVTIWGHWSGKNQTWKIEVEE